MIKEKKKSKIVSFPMMGNVFIPVKAILEGLGATVVLPPENNRKVMNTGVRHSMEGICLPYKLNLANYMMALDRGANTLLMFQAPGSCRFGNYTQMASQTLRDLGYKFEMVVFDMYQSKMKQVIEKFCYVSETKNPLKVINAFRLGFQKFFACDEIERHLFYIRPREYRKGSAELVYTKARKLIDEADTSRKLDKVMKTTLKEYSQIEIDEDKDVPVISIIGEFFVLLDPFTNMDIEKELGKMGVEVRRQIMFSDWIEHVLKPGIFYRKESHRKRALRYAKKFMKRPIGGECLESVGDAVFAAEKNIAGVIHLSPFTCTPEVVAQNILNRVSKQEDIPIISLILDEQTARAGYLTRLEAFVDLVKRKRLKNSEFKDSVERKSDYISHEDKHESLKSFKIEGDSIISKS